MPKVSETDLSERRTDILRGARECFVTHGYDGATVSRLEKETGKSRGAIFHHYRNKETLFREVAHRDMLRMTELASEQGMIGLIRYLLEDPELADWWGLRVEISLFLFFLEFFFWNFFFALTTSCRFARAYRSRTNLITKHSSLDLFYQ